MQSEGDYEVVERFLVIPRRQSLQGEVNPHYRVIAVVGGDAKGDHRIEERQHRGFIPIVGIRFRDDRRLRTHIPKPGRDPSGLLGKQRRIREGPGAAVGEADLRCDDDKIIERIDRLAVELVAHRE